MSGCWLKISTTHHHHYRPRPNQHQHQHHPITITMIMVMAMIISMSMMMMIILHHPKHHHNHHHRHRHDNFPSSPSSLSSTTPTTAPSPAPAFRIRVLAQCTASVPSVCDINQQHLWLQLETAAFCMRTSQYLNGATHSRAEDASAQPVDTSNLATLAKARQPRTVPVYGSCLVRTTQPGLLYTPDTSPFR